MNLRVVYGILCVFGVLLPFSQFVPWLFMYGFDPFLFAQHALESKVSAFAWADVVVSAIVLVVFVVHEGRRMGMTTWWLPIVATLTVGVSLGLPLFLLLRENFLRDNPVVIASRS